MFRLKDFLVLLDFNSLSETKLSSSRSLNSVTTAHRHRFGKQSLIKLLLCLLARAVARKAGDFKLVMIQSSHRFRLAGSSPNLSEFSLAGWAPALRLRCAQPRVVRARLANPPAKLDSGKFGSSRRDQTGLLD